MAVKKKRKRSGLVAYSYLKDGSFRRVGLRSVASPCEILVNTPPDTLNYPSHLKYMMSKLMATAKV